jgi:hypothetical protein
LRYDWGPRADVRWRRGHPRADQARCPSVMAIGHHQPSLRVQRSRTSEMASMIKHKMISGIHRVESLTMTFIPSTDDSEVIGKVMAAITASRSAAMVILVSVRAR